MARLNKASVSKARIYQRLYSWREDRKASPACIRYFVREAMRQKIWAYETATTGEWKKLASLMSLDLAEKCRAQSVHAMARQSMEYARLRAFATTGAADSGSHSPIGWHIDRPAAALWRKLNPTGKV